MIPPVPAGRHPRAGVRRSEPGRQGHCKGAPPPGRARRCPATTTGPAGRSCAGRRGAGHVSPGRRPGGRPGEGLPPAVGTSSRRTDAHAPGSRNRPGPGRGWHGRGPPTRRRAGAAAAGPPGRSTPGGPAPAVARPGRRPVPSGPWRRPRPGREARPPAPGWPGARRPPRTTRSATPPALSRAFEKATLAAASSAGAASRATRRRGSPPRSAARTAPSARTRFSPTDADTRAAVLSSIAAPSRASGSSRRRPGRPGPVRPPGGACPGVHPRPAGTRKVLDPRTTSPSQVPAEGGGGRGVGGRGERAGAGGAPMGSPAAIRTSRAPRARTRSGSWVAITTAPPASRWSAMMSTSSAQVAGSWPNVGSSSSRIPGSRASAVPTLSRRCSPPESVNGSAAARWDRCRRSSIRVARWVASGPGTPAPTSPCCTSSTTRPVTNWCSGFWNTTPKVLAISGDGQRHGSTRSPSDPAPIRTVPAEGSSRPARQASRVDLPEPGGPVTATTSPARTVRSVAGSRSATVETCGHHHDPARLGHRGAAGQVGVVEPDPRRRVGPVGEVRGQVGRARGSAPSRRRRAAHGRRATARPRPGARRRPRCSHGLVRTASTAARTAAADAGSRLAVGSSSRSRCGPATVAAATASSCCCPPLSLEVSRSRGTSNPTASSASATSDQIRAGRDSRVLQGERNVVADALHHDVALRLLLDQPDPRR